MTTAAHSGVEEQLLNTIRGEYSEMPGMRLTRSQFRCLWHLDDDACDEAIATLMTDGFLHRDRAGQLCRADING
jgi:hypothetical protein